MSRISFTNFKNNLFGGATKAAIGPVCLSLAIILVIFAIACLCIGLYADSTYQSINGYYGGICCASCSSCLAILLIIVSMVFAFKSS